MREERLLERLRAMENNPDRRETQNTNRLIHSILNHIQRILNTRQGSTLMAEDFGIPDFTDMSGVYKSEAVREIERSIKEVIKKYEPRLDKVSIGFLPEEDDILAMHLKISALIYDANNLPVVFDTVINGDGKVSVST